MLFILSPVIHLSAVSRSPLIRHANQATNRKTRNVQSALGSSDSSNVMAQQKNFYSVILSVLRVYSPTVNDSIGTDLEVTFESRFSLVCKRNRRVRCRTSEIRAWRSNWLGNISNSPSTTTKSLRMLWPFSRGATSFVVPCSSYFVSSRQEEF